MSELRIKEKKTQGSCSYFALKSPDEIIYQMASIFKATKGMGLDDLLKNRPCWPGIKPAGAAGLSVEPGKGSGQKPDVAHFFLDNIIKL